MEGGVMILMTSRSKGCFGLIWMSRSSGSCGCTDSNKWSESQTGCWCRLWWTVIWAIRRRHSNHCQGMSSGALVAPSLLVVIWRWYCSCFGREWEAVGALLACSFDSGGRWEVGMEIYRNCEREAYLDDFSTQWARGNVGRGEVA